MIKSVKVTNHLGKSWLLELSHPEKSGFIVTNIDGLGPGAASISTSPYATKDGSKFNSARADQRNIVFSILFDPDDRKSSIEQKRHESYKMFPKKKNVTIEIETEERKGIINGYVESNEPIIFSERCGFSVSVICPDPYFYSSEEQETHFWGIEPLFEFPFEDPIPDTPSLEFSEYNLTPQQVILYEGDSDVGLRFEIYLLGKVGNITIYNITAGTSMAIDVSKIEEALGGDLQYGDLIVLTTTTGNKNLYVVRDGIKTNVLSAIDVFTDEWFELTQGENRYAITSAEHIERVHMTAYNKISYEGM